MAATKPTTTAPQQVLSEFWEKYINKSPGKVTRIFPSSLYASLLSDNLPKGQTTNNKVTASYEAAAEECKQKVKRIVRECRRTNEKWSDPDFDIESDFGTDNCLHGLPLDSDSDSESEPDVDGAAVTSALNTITAAKIMPGIQNMDITNLVTALNSSTTWTMPPAESVHRVTWIYDKPEFTINGFDSSDVQQGGEGDCWWVAAVATLCSLPGQMEKVCVARDEECGVYGFVFHRDGNWISTVVDDNLYLSYEDYDTAHARYYDPSGKEARKWKENHQTGSEALAYAKCRDKNETWLPLLEKAYAKVHGDYAAIAGGFAGEGVEDMTGGVTTSLDTNKVLSKDALWKELLRTNKDFLFATGTPSSAGGDTDTCSGLAYQHAYSIHKAVEEEDESGNKIRLVKIRNPWGKRDWRGEGEWNGPWSDGSKEWTPYWLNKLGYKFGDDGEFWMSYDDMLSRFDQLDRTRLFGEEWSVAQLWTSINVSWITGYINTKFVVEVKEASPVVFVLSKLDERYFKGLEGQYNFELHFLLQEVGSEIGDHIARARPSSARYLQRSVSVEILLDAGKYEVIPQIIATKIDGKATVEDVVKDAAEKNPQKLRQIGLNYDVAHLKVAPQEPEVKKGAEKKTGAEEKKKTEPEANPEAPAEEKKAEPETQHEVADDEKKTEPEAKPDAVEDEKKTEPEAKQEVVEDKKEKEPEAKPEVAEEKKKEEPEAEKPAPAATAADKAPHPTQVQQPLGAAPTPAPPGPIPLDPVKLEEKPVDLPKVDDEAKDSAWNAVCTIGLRVYSRGSDISIALETPSSMEEGSALEVDGSAAGATA